MDSLSLRSLRNSVAAVGWGVLPRLHSPADLLEVASQFGTPLRAPTGETEKVLVPRTCPVPLRMNLSQLYGTGFFPFHSDTAFWPMPCRYLVMRATGDVRRSTLLLDFPALLMSLGTDVHRDARRAVWRTASFASGIYCSTYFANGENRGWRYDADVMRPVNSAARRLAAILATFLITPPESIAVDWSSVSSLVVDNWRCLHARAAAPPNEAPRFLSRIYVR